MTVKKLPNKLLGIHIANLMADEADKFAHEVKEKEGSQLWI